ncbi:hypothetical protein [Parasutterella secunda]|uniref:hypothetical protein n=1 Tax=Parasutterella secunda TaxID=626947 RepID=UPI0021ABCA40|nr:hypothetical protein [Parasutterella secunda]MCR8920967.1 hypothetical protein [Parasutterella secunda]
MSVKNKVQTKQVRVAISLMEKEALQALCESLGTTVSQHVRKLAVDFLSLPKDQRQLQSFDLKALSNETSVIALFSDEYRQLIVQVSKELGVSSARLIRLLFLSELIQTPFGKTIKEILNQAK